MDLDELFAETEVEKVEIGHVGLSSGEGQVEGASAEVPISGKDVPSDFNVIQSLGDAAGSKRKNVKVIPPKSKKRKVTSKDRAEMDLSTFEDANVAPRLRGRIFMSILIPSAL